MQRFRKLYLLTVSLWLSAAPLFGQDRTWFPISASTKSAGYSPLWAALKQGYFAQQGLDAQLVVIRGSDRRYRRWSAARCTSRFRHRMRR